MKIVWPNYLFFDWRASALAGFAFSFLLSVPLCCCLFVSVASISFFFVFFISLSLIPARRVVLLYVGGDDLGFVLREARRFLPPRSGVHLGRFLAIYPISCFFFFFVVSVAYTTNPLSYLIIVLFLGIVALREVSSASAAMPSLGGSQAGARPARRLDRLRRRRRATFA